ncbi:MAG TPA: hypothetical protein DCS97_09620 [Planctomycetes bacterium]|nr:hypothetical protein [Planctomycetota bacterium]
MNRILVPALATLCGLTPMGAAEQAPAVLRVTPHVVAPNPGAYTATTGPRHELVDFNFEPMYWASNRFAVSEAAVGKLISANLDWFDSYAGGWWDGSIVRVLRIEDGKMVQKLRGVAKRYERSEWTHAADGLVPASATRGEFVMEDWSRPGQQWWLCVRAVDKAGRVGARSAAVRIVHPDIAGDKRARPGNVFTLGAPRLDDKAAGSAPAAVTGFQATCDPATGLITASWQAALGDIAGYRIERSFTDPATHKGQFIEMGSEGGGDRFAFLPGDMVLLAKTAMSISRSDYAPRLYGTHGAAAPDYAPSFTPTGAWQSREHPSSLVPHPGALPTDVPDGGATCQRIDCREAGIVAIRKFNHADLTQDWYQVLDPTRTYVVEVLARQEGLADPTLRFHLTGPMADEFKAIGFAMTGAWQKFTAEFTVPRKLDQSGSVGQMGLQWNAPGTVWIDNFRVYPKDVGLGRHDAADRAALKASGMGAIRTHDTCKTQGYTLDNLLGHPLAGLTSGKDTYSRGNLSALLKEFREMGVSPWLQLEFTLQEDEWLGLVEYLAAPYDPAKDTPKSKPWAWRRVQHGQVKPYIDEFPKLLIEFSNENWNQIMPFNLAWMEMPDAVTKQTHGAGAIYGMFQEYTIQVLKRSPYWKSMEQKTEFVLGGWAINDFGYQAAKRSPSSRHVLVAAYNGGWDAGEDPSGDFLPALTKTLNYPPQDGIPTAIRLRREADEHAAAGNRPFFIGSYEAGPGYNLDGLNGVRMTPQLVEGESRVMKSLVGGSSTLDCFLGFTYQGAQLQNFFTFSRNRNYWTSHADHRNGGQAYPAWLGLALWNNHGVGEVLGVVTERMPVRAAPAVGRRPAMDAMPEVAAYASRKGDRLSVFAISRRLDAPTPLTLRLPISAAKKVTLHTLTGDPQANNLDAENLRLASRELPTAVATRDFALDAARGAAQGLPPASVFCWVFEGVSFADAAPQALVNPEPGQAELASGLPLRFRVAFTRPPKAFTPADVTLSGTTQAQSCIVTMVPGSHGLEWTVTVTEVMDEGRTTVTAKDLAAADGSTIRGGSGSLDLRFPAGTVLPLLAWNFSKAQEGMEKRDWKGQAIAPTARMPVVEATTLQATPQQLLGDNEHYNIDGAGTWAPGEQVARAPFYFAIALHPASGKALDIKRVDCGFWSSGDLKPRLEVWQGGIKVGEAAFTAAKVINNKGDLGATTGIPASADTSGIPALQKLASPVELRIVFAGLEEKGGVFGIGKLGLQADDLVVLGRLSGH